MNTGQMFERSFPMRRTLIAAAVGFALAAGSAYAQVPDPSTEDPNTPFVTDLKINDLPLSTDNTAPTEIVLDGLPETVDVSFKVWMFGPESKDKGKSYDPPQFPCTTDKVDSVEATAEGSIIYGPEDEPFSGATIPGALATPYAGCDQLVEFEWAVDELGVYEVVATAVKDGATTDKDGNELDPPEADKVGTMTGYVEFVLNAETCWYEEGAWSAGDAWPGASSPATYTAYNGAAITVDLLAARDQMLAGTVDFSAPDNNEVTITIELEDGWRFAEEDEEDGDDNVYVQGYDELPEDGDDGFGNPRYGQFANKDKAEESPFEIVVPEANFYVVKVSVEEERACAVNGE